jgi:ArsR family transcriptional regulator, arsenate/arsenite/antimonite-responsive transcriptional repressor
MHLSLGTGTSRNSLPFLAVISLPHCIVSSATLRSRRTPKKIYAFLLTKLAMKFHLASSYQSCPHARYLTALPYFCNHRNMPTAEKTREQLARYADMFSAMGTEPRLRIMQLLLSAHPDGLVVGDIQAELDIPNSTLSHHLDKLRNEDLVSVQRESTFLRYTANTESLQELLQFLYAECCTRNKALRPQDVLHICK